MHRKGSKLEPPMLMFTDEKLRVDLGLSCSLENSIPEVVATQLWLAPLFGTLCGTPARAAPGKTISAATMVAPAFGPFLLTIPPPYPLTGDGVLGVVPGTMADPGYLTVGLGADESLSSASHGAGRRMSRTKAFKQLDGSAWRQDLREKGITLLGGALDEAPAAYKDPRAVMASQADLVETLGEFSPGIVRMDAGSGKNRRRRKAGRS